MIEPQEWQLKHRPKTIDRMEGNTAAVSAIKAMFASNNIPHFILLTGNSGSGKTSIGRIIKNQLGCHDLDYKEYNSAVFRGIDTARDLQRGIRISPAAGPCRVILLDEVQSTTRDAQEALLKVLEEPPQHVYFILCTTDPQKLIAPLRNRATEIRTEKLSNAEAAQLLARVCKREGVEFEASISQAIIEGAEGCARALLVNAQKVAAVPEGEREAVAAVAKEATAEGIDLCRALIAAKAWPDVARILAGVKGEPESIRRGVLGYCKTVLLKEGKSRNGMRAYKIMSCFSNNLYETGAAGLVYQAFEAVCGD